MDNAYHSLNGISNTLIQTSAAAERVFALIECQSDIEKVPQVQKVNSWGVEINQGGELSNEVEENLETERQSPSE